jgi:hypothetical protein
VNAFQAAEPPQLAANRSGTNLVVSWVSPAPGFVLQQAARLFTGIGNWIDSTNSPWLAGSSNLVTLTLPSTATNQFFRARQR